MAIDAKVSSHHFHLHGVDYFRGQADVVQLGDAGEKTLSGPQEACIAVRASLPRHQLTIDRATQIDMHRVAISGSDIGAGITIPGVGVLSAATVARQLEDQALSLVKLECAPKDIVAAAHGSSAVITALVRAGAAGRLVHQAFVILEMKTALNFTRSTRFEVSGSARSWAITGADGSRTVVAMTPGTTFAYLLLKPQSRATLQAHGQRIDDWEAEPWRLQ